jgi:hypothetical protein
MSTAKNRMLVGEFGSSRIDLKVRPHWHYQTLEQKRAVLNDLFLRQKEIRNPIGGVSYRIEMEVRERRR